MASVNTWFSAASTFLRPQEVVQTDVTIRVLTVEQTNNGNYRVSASTGVGDVVFFTDSVLTVGQALTADLCRNAGRSDGLVAVNIRS
jgi:hypothetical protein